MTKEILFILIAVNICSCTHKPATNSQIKMAIMNEKFDESIILKLNQYEELKRYFNSKSDTIIKFNNNIPEHITNELKRISNSIGKGSVKFYDLNEDNIGIEVKITENKNGLYLSHNLIWSRNEKLSSYLQRDYTYIEQKDSMINNTCLYRIGLKDYNAPNKIYGPPTIHE